MKKFCTCILLISVTLSSCNFNSHYTDRPQDREEAERVTVKFYYLLRDKKYSEAHSLFSPRFLEVTNDSRLDELFKSSDDQLGEIQDQTLETWKTNRVDGSNPISEYLLIYNVKRTKFNSRETIRLEKEKDEIKILAYNVQSEGFLNHN